MRKFQPLQVDLGDFGKHILTFDEVNVKPDTDQQLREQASDYAWYSSVLSELKAVYEDKVLAHKTWLAEQREKITEQLIKSKGKKPTDKYIDAVLQMDSINVNLQKELISWKRMIDKIKDFLPALNHKIVDVREISARERAGLSAISRNVSEENLINKVKENRGRGHDTASVRREREE